MRFIDSNVLVYAFYKNKNTEKCQEIIKEGGIISTVNIIESFNIIEYETNREHATKAMKSLLKSNLKIVDVDVNLIFEAFKKAPIYKKLRFIDLVHFTTAFLQGCNSIISYDRDFDKLPIQREEP